MEKGGSEEKMVAEAKRLQGLMNTCLAFAETKGSPTYVKAKELWQELMDGGLGAVDFENRQRELLGRPLDETSSKLLRVSLAAFRHVAARRLIVLSSPKGTPLRPPRLDSAPKPSGVRKRPAEARDLSEREAQLMVAKAEETIVKSEAEDDGYGDDGPVAKRPGSCQPIWRCEGDCKKAFRGYAPLRTHVKDCLKVSLPDQSLLTEAVRRAMANTGTLASHLVRLWAQEHGLPSAEAASLSASSLLGAFATSTPSTQRYVPGPLGPHGSAGFPAAVSTPLQPMAPPSQPPPPAVSQAEPARPASAASHADAASAMGPPASGPGPRQFLPPPSLLSGALETELLRLLQGLKKEVGDMRQRMESMEASLMLKLNALERRLDDLPTQPSPSLLHLPYSHNPQ